MTLGCWGSLVCSLLLLSFGCEVGTGQVRAGQTLVQSRIYIWISFIVRLSRTTIEALVDHIRHGSDMKSYVRWNLPP